MNLQAPSSYRREIVFSSLALHGFGLALPVFMMQLYDRIIPNSTTATLVILSAAAVAFTVLEVLTRMFRQNWALWNAETALFRARRKALEAILLQGVSRRRLKEVFSSLRYLILNSHMQQSFFLGDIPFGIIYLAGVFFIHPFLGSFLLVLGGLQLAVFHHLRGTVRQHLERQKFLKKRLSALSTSVLSSLPSLKALASEELVLNHHQVLVGKLLGTEKALARHEMIRVLVNRGLSSLSVFGPIIIGGAFVVQGQLTLGAVTAVVLLARRALAPLSGLAERWFEEAQLKTAAAVVEPYFGSEGVQAGQSLGVERDLPIIGAARLEFQNVIIRSGLRAGMLDDLMVSGSSRIFSMEEESIVLRMDSAVLEPGTMAVLPSRSGFPGEELFAALRRANPFFSGQILLGGYRLARFSRQALGRKILLVQENETLFPGTFLENLGSFQPEYYSQARDAAAMLDLDSYFQKLERGYNSEVTESLLGVLSKGLVQRLALARALALRPSILLLDRFDGAMDQESARVCRQVISRVLPLMTVMYHGADPLYSGFAHYTAHFRSNRLELVRTEKDE